jgi:hypothetical protein
MKCMTSPPLGLVERRGFVELIASAVVGRPVEKETRQARSHPGSQSISQISC